MSVIQRAVDEISAVEERLEQYDHALVAVRQSLKEMGREKSKMEVTQRNHHELLQTLDNMLVRAKALKQRQSQDKSLGRCMRTAVHGCLMDLGARVSKVN